MTYTDGQIRAFNIVTRISACISLLGSSLIIHDITKDPVKRRRTYSRILMGASVLDVLVSFMYFLGPWPIDEGSSNSSYAKGTTSTCTAQGFFIQMSLATPVYYLGLAMYYWLVLVHSWSDIRLRSLEWRVHCGAVVLSVGTAVAGLPLELYNDDGGLWCWISSLPESCGNSIDGDPDECSRGLNAWIYRWALFNAPIGVAVLLITAIMCRVTLHVWQQERQSRKWRLVNLGLQPAPDDATLGNISTHSNQTAYSFSNDDKLRKLTSRVFWQSVNYILAFYITWVFPTVVRYKQTVGDRVSPGLLICMCIFLPLQGIWNFGVYFRPRYERLRERYPDRNLLEVWWTAIWTKYVTKRRRPRKPKKPTTTSLEADTSADDGNGDSTISMESRTMMIDHTGRMTTTTKFENNVKDGAAIISTRRSSQRQIRKEGVDIDSQSVDSCDFDDFEEERVIVESLKQDTQTSNKQDVLSGNNSFTSPCVSLDSDAYDEFGAEDVEDLEGGGEKTKNQDVPMGAKSNESLGQNIMLSEDYDGFDEAQDDFLQLNDVKPARKTSMLRNNRLSSRLSNRMLNLSKQASVVSLISTCSDLDNDEEDMLDSMADQNTSSRPSIRPKRRSRQPDRRSLHRSIAEEDADIMDPAHMYMMLSQRSFGAAARNNQTSNTSPRKPWAMVKSSIGAIIEEGQEEDDAQSNGSRRQTSKRSRRGWNKLMDRVMEIKDSKNNQTSNTSPRKPWAMVKSSIGAIIEEGQEEDDAQSNGSRRNTSKRSRRGWNKLMDRVMEIKDSMEKVLDRSERTDREEDNQRHTRNPMTERSTAFSDRSHGVDREGGTNQTNTNIGVPEKAPVDPEQSKPTGEKSETPKEEGELSEKQPAERQTDKDTGTVDSNVEAVNSSEDSNEPKLVG